jgi:putative flippase GtrA
MPRVIRWSGCDNASSRKMPGIFLGESIMSFLNRRPVIFILVGSAAALTHLMTVIFLVENIHMAPLVANVGGWVCAFGVSYGGHFLLTFADQAAPAVQSVVRFFVLSASGFVINESAYAILLRTSSAPYPLLLAIILVCVAVLTYLLSRHWAFADTRP